MSALREWIERLVDRWAGTMRMVVERDQRGQWWLVSPLNGALRIRLEPGVQVSVRWWGRR